MPLEALQPLGQSASADLLIRLPTEDLHRQARFRGMPVADLPPYVRRIAEGYSALFGDKRFEWLALWRAAEAEGGAELAEAQVAEHYRARLAALFPDFLVHALRLPLPADASSMALHLYLVTRESERALLLNRVFFDLQNQGYLPWVEVPSEGPVHLEREGSLDLFFPNDAAASAFAAGNTRKVRRVDFPALAHTLAVRFADRTVLLRDVMREVLDTGLFPAEVRRALHLLRSDGRVHYTSLAHSDVQLTFGERSAPQKERTAGRSSEGDEPMLW